MPERPSDRPPAQLRVVRPFVVASALLAGCSGVSSGRRIAPPPPVAAPGGADAVHLLDETVVRFQLVEGRVVADKTYRRHDRILRESGHELARFYFPYTRGFEQPLSFEGRTITASGDLQTFTLADMADLPAFSGGSLYDDGRVKVLDASSVPDGTTVEATRVLRNLEPKLFEFSHAFAASRKTLESRFVVEHPVGWEVGFLVTRLAERVDWAPRVEEADGIRRLIWEKKDLAPLEPEELAPAWRFRSDIVHAWLSKWVDANGPQRGFDDLKGVSRFVHALAEDTKMLPAEAKKVVAEVLGDGPRDPETKARKLYAWVCEHVQYCAVELGLGGWKPHAVGDTFNKRNGDCKDKANLLRALLDEAGVPSRLASVYSHEGFPNRFHVPVLAANANHMILMVDLPDRTVVVDPTERTVPFGELPTRDQGAELLPATAEGSEPTPGQWSSADDNGRDVTLELALGLDGNARGTLVLTTRGTDAQTLRWRLLHAPATRHPKVLAEFLGRPAWRIKPTSLPTTIPLAPEPLVIQASVELDDVFADAGVVRTLNAVPITTVWPPRLPEAQRTTPTVMGAPRTEREKVSLRLPDGLRLSHVPGKNAKTSGPGECLHEWRSEGGKVLHFERRWVVRQPVVAATDYEKLRDLVATLRGSSANLVVFEALAAEARR